MSSRVLLVVNDLGYQGQIVRALRARGIGVDAFDSAEAVMKAFPPRVLWARALITLHLPDNDGVNLGEWLLEKNPKIELNFLSTSTDADTLSRAQRIGTVLWQPIGMGPLCEQFSRNVRSSGVYSKNETATADTPETAGTGTDAVVRPLKRR